MKQMIGDRSLPSYTRSAFGFSDAEATRVNVSAESQGMRLSGKTSREGTTTVPGLVRPSQAVTSTLAWYSTPPEARHRRGE